MQNALIRAGMDMAEIVPQSKSEAMFRSNLEDIKSRFAILLRSVQSALEANHVAPEDVYAVLVGMFNCGESIPKTNLEDIFSAVTNHRLWDYTHHSPVEKLLRRFIPDHLSVMREYKAHLSGFYTTTKLIDYITYTNIDSTVDREIDLGHLTVANYQKLKVKLKLDRKIDTISLKYVQDLWEEFAEEFDIPFLTAVIGKLLSGSLLVIWMITPDTAKQIATAAHKLQFFQEHPNIIYVAIDDTVHYDEEESCMIDFKHQLEEGVREYYCTNERNIATISVSSDDLMNAIEQNVTFVHAEKDPTTREKSYTISMKSNAIIQCADNRLSSIRMNTIPRVTNTAQYIKKFVGLITIPLSVGFFAGLIAILLITGIANGFINKLSIGFFTGTIAGAIVVAVVDAGIMPNVSMTQSIPEFLYAILTLLIIIIYLSEYFARGRIRATFIGASAGFVTATFDTRIARTLVRFAKHHANIILIIVSPVLFGVIYEIVNRSPKDHVLHFIGTTSGAYAGAFTGAYSGFLTADFSDAEMRTSIGLPSKVIADGTIVGTIVGGLLGAVKGVVNMVAYAIGVIVGTTLSVRVIEIFDEHLRSTTRSYNAIGAFIESSQVVGNTIVIAGTTVPKESVVFAFIRSVSKVPKTSDSVLLAFIGSVIGAAASTLSVLTGFYFMEAAITLGFYTLMIFYVEHRVHKIKSNKPANPTEAEIEAIFSPEISRAHRIVKSIILLVLGGYFGAVLPFMAMPFINLVIGALKRTQSMIPFGKLIVTLTESMTKVANRISNIQFGGLGGGFLAGVAIGFYRTNTIRTIGTSANEVNKLEAVTLGVVGAVAGCFTVAIYDAAGDPFLTAARIALIGAGLGGIVGGVLVVAIRIIATVIIASTDTTNSLTFISVAGGLVGIITGVYSTSGFILTCLMGITFSITTVTILTTAVYVANKFRRPSKSFILIPLNDIVAKFGKVTKPSIDLQGNANDNWIQYKIALQQNYNC